MRQILTLCTLLPFVALPALAAELPAGPTLDLRWRLEVVDDEALARDAQANTLRARLGYRTPVRAGWRGVVEVEGTGHLFGEDFNSSANGQLAWPTVADPDNAELNQLYAEYRPDDGSRLAIGRQRLAWDNQRFFGNVGWRQNEQTFDAIDGQHRFGNGWSWRYSYLDRVQRVFGADHPNRDLGRWRLDAHLLSASHAVGPGTLTAYAHVIRNQTLPLGSHRNLGLRYVARRDVPEGLGWQATVELARQDSHAGGAANIDAGYALLEGALVWRGHTVKAGWEQLGGDGSYGFATPFATLHAFNGWADKFLTTPADGLQDAYLGWSRKFGAVTAQVAWHDFRSDHGSRHYGSEWDASLAWAFRPRWTALAKWADYQADDFARDTRKFWLSVEFVY